MKKRKEKTNFKMDMFSDISLGKKVIFILLVLALIVALYFLIYSLVYARPESMYRKNAIVVGLSLIVLGRFTTLFYKKYVSRR